MKMHLGANVHHCITTSVNQNLILRNNIYYLSTDNYNTDNIMIYLLIFTNYL